MFCLFLFVILRLFVFLYEGIEAPCIGKDAVVFFRGIFTKTEGSNAHGFGIVLYGEFYYCTVHLSAEDKSDRRILMGHSRLLVKQREVERELSEMGGLVVRQAHQPVLDLLSCLSKSGLPFMSASFFACDHFFNCCSL